MCAKIGGVGALPSYIFQMADSASRAASFHKVSGRPAKNSIPADPEQLIIREIALPRMYHLDLVLKHCQFS